MMSLIIAAQARVPIPMFVLADMKLQSLVTYTLTGPGPFPPKPAPLPQTIIPNELMV